MAPGGSITSLGAEGGHLPHPVEEEGWGECPGVDQQSVGTSETNKKKYFNNIICLTITFNILLEPFFRIRHKVL